MPRTTRSIVFYSALIQMFIASTVWAQPNVATRWNEALLEAIRLDFPAPTVHSRNLYHVSAGMYDAWTAFDAVSNGHFYTQKHSTLGIDVDQTRSEAISFAAYRILSERYALAVDPAASQHIFDTLMDDLGYDKGFSSTSGNSPAAIGNRIASHILETTLNDGSNEINGYVDNTGYAPVNLPMVVDYPSVVTPDAPPLADANRWQPLYLESAITQNELEGENLQTYVGPHWGSVTTFALGRNAQAGEAVWSSLDPGSPPKLNGNGDAEYRSDTVLLIEYSAGLDPNQGTGAMDLNISPRVAGNRELGTHTNRGYSQNPVTGQPYEDNIVKAADYARVLAEFWADGPNSETPPGHWNVLANQVSQHPLHQNQIQGTGDVVDDLEWNVKLYLALNGAVHDAAVAAWGTKREYDYVRPITKIRYQGKLGQSTDVDGPSYHPDGLPLQDGLIEVITAESIAEGGRHRNAYVNANQDAEGNFFRHLTESELVGKIAIRSWNHEPADPDTEVSGTAWILAENWVPYQDDNFVTPAFAAYVSGHSTFSRAAAEVLALITGSDYFPGGLGEATFETDFLKFEKGPSEQMQLQWATYFDAADEAGISRLHGGIHVPADDFSGRIMGSQIGVDAFHFAREHFDPDEVGWFNRVNSNDVTNDTFVSAVDVLRVVQENNKRDFSDPTTGLLSDIVGAPPYFCDTNNDGYATAKDALLIVQYINNHPRQLQVSAIAAVPEPRNSHQGVLLLSILTVYQSRRVRRKNRS